MTSGEPSEDIPYYLMPVAAVLGMYSLIASITTLYQIYKKITYKPDPKKSTSIPPPSLLTPKFLGTIISIIIAILGYGVICAKVNNSLMASDVFDPFDILGIDTYANSTAVKQAYRSLSKTHHPDKGGDTEVFQRINLAYKALSDSVAKQNWEEHGHPDGPQSQTFAFALPDWLLHPQGNVALILLLLYFGMFISIIIYVVKTVTKSDKQHAEKMKNMSVSESDMAYLATHLSPDSTHLEVLYYIATTPENIEMTSKDLEKADELKRQRIAFLNPSAAAATTTTKTTTKSTTDTKKNSNDFDMDDAGWADDDEDENDEQIQAAKKAKEEKEKLAKQVAEATGKTSAAEMIKIEGVDDGVLGQEWVERTLAHAKQWPPKFFLENPKLKQMTFSLLNKDGGSVGAVATMEHRQARRNFCMTMGRLNSTLLNTHPDILQASQKQLIDGTYFKATMEYRQRTGLLLEAALRVAASTRSYRLYKTIVQAVAMFKIGIRSATDPDILNWFRGLMAKTYDGEKGIPSLVLGKKLIETPDEDEVATEDICALEVEVERTHAENFSKQKIAVAMKQGIPPQVAMSAYREGWWILLRCKKLDGDNESKKAAESELDKNPVFQALNAGAKAKFEAEKEEHRLLTAWPFIVSNVAQKSGTVKVRFRAPSIPGKYKFFIDVLSQEFIGCDQSFTIEKEVVDKNDIVREAEDGGNEGDGHELVELSDSEDDEDKKTK